MVSSDAPVLARPTARPALPSGPVDVTEAWLRNRRLSEHTRDAYRRDVTAWLSWCAGHDLDPLRATFLHINEYARALEATRRPQRATVDPGDRGTSAVGAVQLVRLPRQARRRAGQPGLRRGPARVDRDHSATVGLTPEEVDALLAAADAETGPTAPRNRAAIALLADLGLRVGELVSLDLTDLGTERGHRSVRFVGKGGKQRRRALTPGTAYAVDAYLAQRAATAGVPVTHLTGPLLVTASGARLDRHSVFRMVRRLARAAGIAAWARLSPHSLRHAFATTARSEGVPLEDVQDAMGHADPRTTRRYDRDRHNLDRDPAYAVWAAVPSPRLTVPPRPTVGG